MRGGGMIFYSDDPAADAERYMAYQDMKLARRPKCDCCGNHIQEETALYYNDVYICDKCVERNTQYVEDE
jgi:hypothetical protein